MKYLVSLYFDDKTKEKLQKHMAAVAERSGNRYMLNHEVPPHITVSSFEAEDEEAVKEALQACLGNRASGELHWVSVGTFMPSVLYIMPVLNVYLQELMQAVYGCVKEIPGVTVSKYYQPFRWLPHTTIGKKMAEDELLKGFQVMQESFRIIRGNVAEIGLAKASPYEDIVTWRL